MEEFLQWLNANRHLLCEDTQALFDDSVKCYKNDIFRAAYLLAYQGVMRQVKEEILKADNVPNGFSTGEWDGWKRQMSNLDKWDTKVLEAIKLRPKPDIGKDGILAMKEDVRIQFDTFWRVLRNECAHHKGGTFIQAYVLVFYAFIKDELLLISVAGGMRTLLHEFEIYCDDSLTSSTEPIRPLLEKISVMVRPMEHGDFINGVRIIMGRSYHRSFLQYIQGVYEYCHEDFKNSMTAYLNDNEELQCKYIDENPGYVLTLLKDKTEIHKFWYLYLCTLNKPLSILAFMLKGGLINADERNEAFEKVQSYMYKWNKAIYDLSEEEKNVLAEYGYFDYFLNKYFVSDFTSSNYQAICYKTDFYISYLFCFEINEVFVEHIIDVFSNTYPYTLCDRIKKEFMEEPDLKSKIDKVCVDTGLALPAAF